MQRWNSPHHDVRRVPAYTQPVGCVYADRRVYAPDAAFTHMCLYAVVRAFTRAVGAYTHLAYMYMAVVHPGVYTRGSVAVYASGGCVYTGGVYTHPTRIHRFLRICTPVPRPSPDRVYVGSSIPASGVQIRRNRPKPTTNRPIYIPTQ